MGDDGLKEEIKIFILNYKYRIIISIIGLLVGLLFLSIGFWATLLLVICTGAGWIIGARKDDNPAKIEIFIENIISRRRD